MRMVAETAVTTGPPECSGGGDNAEDDSNGGEVVVVGVKLDTRSRELLTWALVKVAQSGDRVVALHVLDPGADKSSLLSLVKTFDSVLAAYEGFCNLKQVDLKLKVCRGSPVRKILSQEAKSCGATKVILGTSAVNHKLRSRISVAKYCAKNLKKDVSVVCVDNSKVVFRRESVPSSKLEFRSLHASESRFKRRRTLSKSPLSLPPQRVQSLPAGGSESISMALVPVKAQETQESKSRWSLLRRVFLPGKRVSEASSTKKPSVVQRIFKLPSRQSVSAIFPDQKQVGAPDRNDCCSGLDGEEGAIVLYSADTESSSNEIFPEELESLVEKYSATCRLFSYQELLLATNNFAPGNLIGKGGSSRVYKGTLPGAEELAVKVLKPSEDVLRHFVSEIEIITSLHHKNIISLVGFCIGEDRLLLVYNLLCRGCLEDNLHGTREGGNVFRWEQRYKVALGVADALDHLHNTDEPIIHRDVKSSNILLSNDYEPQLSDFGLATWASSSSHDIGTSDVAGTFGYLAPEYFMQGKLNEKVDVYAFGVVLLELLSGRKPIDNEHGKGQESLVMWARQVLEEGKISELQDPHLVTTCDDDEFEKMVLAARLCIRHAPQSRPEISYVLKLLQGDPEATEWARQEANSSEVSNSISGEQSAKNIQSFINLALLDLEDNNSVSSTEQNVSVEDYLGGRWSRSSSFN